MKEALSLIVFMIVFLTNMEAQGIENARFKWIECFSEFRNSILLKNPPGIEDVKQLTDKWKNIRSRKSELDEFVDRLYAYSISTDFEAEKIVEGLRLTTANSKLNDNLRIEDVRTIRENTDLFELMQLGILEREYPFKISTDSELIEEMLHYEIMGGQRVGEIGAGVGDFSLILHRILPRIELYINELQQENLLRIKEKIDSNLEDYDIDRISLIIGNEESTNLEEYELDRIIIRNAFHHFDDKERMLESIKESLESEGKLYVLEKTKDLNKKKDRCGYSMREKDIVEVFEMNGYELVEDVEIGENKLFVFEILKN